MPGEPMKRWGQKRDRHHDETAKSSVPAATAAPGSCGRPPAFRGLRHLGRATGRDKAALHEGRRKAGLRILRQKLVRAMEVAVCMLSFHS